MRTYATSEARAPIAKSATARMTRRSRRLSANLRRLAPAGATSRFATLSDADWASRALMMDSCAVEYAPNSGTSQGSTIRLGWKPTHDARHRPPKFYASGHRIAQVRTDL